MDALQRSPLKRSPFGRLPEGVSSHIFSFLETPQDLVRCQATCRSWKSSVAGAMPHRLLIDTFSLEWTGSGQLVRWLAKHKTLIQHVREVNFIFHCGLDAELWEVVLLSANHLEALIVENFLPEWDKGHIEVELGEAELTILPRSLTFLRLQDVDADADEAWASVPSELQLHTLDLAESNLPSPLPACMASLTCLHLWLKFRNESRPLGASDFDDIALGCPMLQQLWLDTDRGQEVDSWEPLTHLQSLQELNIVAYPVDGSRSGPFPAVDLDAFPAMQSFSAAHCAGVKGHVHGAYVESGYVESISLTSIRHV